MKKYLKLISFAFCAFFITVFQSHAQTDSLVNALKKAKDIEKLSLYTKLIKQLAQSQPKKAIDYGEEALKFLKRNKVDINQQATFYNTLALAYYYNKDNRRAIKYYEQAYVILEKTNKNEAMYCAFTLGNLNSFQKRHQDAAEMYVKALEISKQQKNAGISIELIDKIANSYFEAKKYDLALQYFRMYFIEIQNSLTREKEELIVVKSDFQTKITQREKLIQTQKEKLYTAAKNEKILIEDTTLKREQIVELNKEKMIQKLELDNKALQLKTKNLLLKQKEDTLKILIVIGVIIVIFSLALVRAILQIKKKNKELAIQQAAILKNNQAIQIQHNLIVEKNILIEEKNTNIMNSIRYARKIQEAVMPVPEMLAKHVDEYFYIFKPKDIVSGDFFWWHHTPEKTIFVLADCTGHGVPGAFMSMLGITLLNEIVKSNGIHSPEAILNRLRDEIIVALKQEIGDSTPQDGMDLIVITINKDKTLLEFAGANNPLYILKENNLTELKGDKMPVGIFRNMAPFQKHEIQLSGGEVIYAFSDGFVDQFGADDKKFTAKRLRELALANYTKPLKIQRSIFDDSFQTWKGIENQIDDVLLFGIKI